MSTVTATYAKNNIGDVWEMAKAEPVEVLSNGAPVAVIVSPEQFAAMKRSAGLGRPRRLGALAKACEGFDREAFLNTDISGAFSDYRPS